MNFLKEHKRLVWSLLGAILIIGAIIYVNVSTYLDMRRANIFDEVYQETKRTYHDNNILGKIDGFDIKPSWPWNDGNPVPGFPSLENEPWGKYKSESLPEGYARIVINFHFNNNAQSCYIGFEKTLDSNASLLVGATYRHKKQTLTKTVAIFKEKTASEESQRIDDEAKVKAYLKDYGITAVDLDSYYDEIINKKVLTDWCSIYESKFSPDNYGDVTIKTQWEGWKI